MRCKIPANDLAQKIGETICRYKGDPVWVRIPEKGSNKVDVYELPSTDKLVARIQKDDEDFDISSIALGYVNSTKVNRALYLTRLPLRRTKQGIDPRSIKVESITEGRSEREHAGSTSVLLSQGFVNMVKGVFPTLEEALNTLRRTLTASGDAGSLAISRDIALSIDKMGIIRVHYKNNYVGWIQPDKFIVHVKHDEMAWVVSKYLSHVLGWQVD